MRRGFDAARRAWSSRRLALTQPVVDTADPTVEGLLLASPQTGQRSIALANWAYGVTAILKTAQGRRTPRIELLPVEKLTITVRGRRAGLGSPLLPAR